MGSNVDRISSSATSGCTWPSGSRPPSAQVGPAAVAAAELDVRLAQQRLDPQRRAGVGRDRRVLALDLERCERAAVLGVDLQSDDAADVDAGDSHVGAAGELVGLRERDLDPVTLGGERDRAAEADPEIREHEHAREHEADQAREAKWARRRLDHFGTASPPLLNLQELLKFGRSNSSSSVSSVGFCFGLLGVGAVDQVQRSAVEQQHPLAQRADAILARERRVGVVARPRHVEQVALAVGRLERELVDDVVELVRERRQTGGRLGEPLGRGREHLRGRLRLDRERPQLVAEDRRRLRQRTAAGQTASARARVRSASAR